MRRYPIGRARPVDVVTEVFTKAQAIRDRWPYLHDNRFRWRMDRAHFDAIAAASDGPEPVDEHGLAEIDPRFADVIRERHEEWEKRRRLHEDSWGKEGNQLVGWPIVCDETYPGIDPEVVIA